MTVEMFVSMLRGLQRAGRKGTTIKSLSESLDVSKKPSIGRSTRWFSST